jgi:hypothetical protein
MASAAAHGATQAFHDLQSKIVHTETTKMLSTMRVANVINGVALIALGVVAFTLSCDDDMPYSSGLIKVYCMLFGLGLVLFELRTGARYHAFVRKYFGFMYSFMGKTFLIIFTATLSYSLMGCSDPLALAVGIYTSINGLFNCFVIFNHPAFANGPPKEAASRDLPYMEDLEIGSRGGQMDQYTRQQATQPSSAAQYGASAEDDGNPFAAPSDTQPAQSYSGPTTYASDGTPVTHGYDAPSVPSYNDVNGDASAGAGQRGAQADVDPFGGQSGDGGENPFADGPVRDVL